jgi:MFS family permease
MAFLAGAANSDRSKEGSIRGVFVNHAFRNLWLGQMCSQLATNMMLFILGIRIYQNTGSNAAVSGLYVSYGIPAVVFGMVAGVVVDRLDKRMVLAVCNVSRTVLMAFLFAFPDNLVVVYVIMFFNAILSQFYVPAEAPMIPYLVNDKQLISANSMFSFSYYTSMATGFVIAGPVLKYFGPTGAFLTVTLLYIIAIWSVTQIPKLKEQTVGIAKALHYDVSYLFRRVMTDLSKGLSYAVKETKVLDALILLTGTQTVLSILATLGPGFADRILHIEVTDASMVILAPAVLGIIGGALWLGNFGAHLNTKKITTFGILSGGILLIIIAMVLRAEHYPFLNMVVPKGIIIPASLFLFFLLGIANSFLDVPSNTIVQKEATGDMRGKMYGILGSVGGGFAILPVIAGGFLADVLGIGKVLVLMGAAITVYGIIRIRSVK